MHKNTHAHKKTPAAYQIKHHAAVHDAEQIARKERERGERLQVLQTLFLEKQPNQALQVRDVLLSEARRPRGVVVCAQKSTKKTIIYQTEIYV